MQRSRSLNLRKGLLQLLQLRNNISLRLLSTLKRLSLERLNGLELSVQVESSGLEGLELSLDLVDDGLVAQDGAVVREVDGLGKLGESLEFTAGIVVALLEGLEGGGGLAAEGEGAGHFGPVEFGGGAALFEGGKWESANWRDGRSIEGGEGCRSTTVSPDIVKKSAI